MPRGQGRPFNKDLRTISQSYLYKHGGLATEVSKAMENKRVASAAARKGTQPRLKQENDWIVGIPSNIAGKTKKRMSKAKTVWNWKKGMWE